MQWWNSLFRKRVLNAQLDRELRFHLDELTQANVSAGMSPQEARRQAILEFGGQEQIKEDLRDVHRISWIETAGANLKSAFRFLRKSPTFSITVILTLALGIGANSAVFSAIDAILLRPLPFPDGDALMKITQYNTKSQHGLPFVAPVRVEDWNRLSSAFRGIAGYYTENNSETSGPLPEKLTEAFVTPRFLQVLGVSPALGRDFSRQEEHFGSPPVLLISDRFWRRRFGADPGVVGKRLVMAGYSWSIIGVLPASFSFPNPDVDLWAIGPPDAPYAQSREYTWYTVIGRLKPDATLEQARANLAMVQIQLGKQYPKPDADLAVQIQPLKETIIHDVSRSLWLLFGSVSLLLLIACLNIVALLLSRAAQRQHEISVRFSLGASRFAILSQLLTEAFVLAVIGALLGLLLARGASGVFHRLAADLPRVDEIHLDWRLVHYSLACSVIVTIACGLVPALRSTRAGLSASLAQTSRSQVSSHTPLQWLLVAVQVALAIVLLAGAGLLLRSFQALGRVSPGFEASRILTFRISGSYGETTDWRALTARIDRTLQELQGLPGIEAAAASATTPGEPAEYPTELRFAEGQQDPLRKMVAESRFVTPAYFAAMQIPLVSGEVCREPQFRSVRSPQSPTGVLLQPIDINVLVNRSFAETYLAGTTVLGHHIQVLNNSFLQPDELGEIRGVVGDAREEGLNRPPSPTVYWCVGAPGGPDPIYLVRTHSAPMTMASTIRQKIRDIEPSRSVFDIASLNEKIDDSFAENRIRTVLLSFFAATAIALACVGLYGTLSYSVNTRQREIGLRLALGALQGQIAKQFLLQGLGVTLLGSLAGGILAAMFARVLSGMLYGVSPWDATTLSAVLLLVLIVAAVASLLPAKRAAHVDPMQVLREE